MAIRRYRFLLAIALGAIVALGLGAYVAAVTTTTGSGKVKSFNGVQAASGQNDCITAATPNDDYVDMPGMVLNLSGSGPFVVLFQGQFYSDLDNASGSRVVISAYIDGVPVGSFFAIGNQLEDFSMQTYGFNSFSGVLAAGPHELKVRWRVTSTGARACVEERSLIVLEP